MAIPPLLVSVVPLILSFVLAPSAPRADKDPVVTTGQGAVLGSTLTSRGGRQFQAFKSIPYAKPPVGALRFKDPVPAGPWNGTLDGQREAPDCLQKQFLLPGYPVSGQEDCLYLNVYTPQLPSPGKTPLPVMVYVNQGGWFSGSASSMFLGPKFIMDKDVVLVTFNYRLGVFGFLSTGDEHSPGNYALKDQALALAWVRTNIAAFGGDPQTVTLFGQSAGAGSVHLHLVSPLSKGLFHRAISQSGTLFGVWAFPDDASAVARHQGALLNCTSEASAELVACLRDVDATALVESTGKLHFWSVDKLTTYRPVIESGPGAFLPNDPKILIANGQFSKVPYIQGVVNAEGIMRGLTILYNRSLTADLNSRVKELMPLLMELPSSLRPEEVEETWNKIAKYYFGTENPTFDIDVNAKEFIQLYGDRGFYHPLNLALQVHGQSGHSDIYAYTLDYRGMYSFTGIFVGDVAAKDYGVSHCDDLLYLFDMPGIFPPLPNNTDLELSNILLTMWTNFAKYGKPTPEQLQTPPVTGCTSGADVSSLAWHPAISTVDGPLNFLDISKVTDADNHQSIKLCERSGDVNERMAFWNSLPLAENSLRHSKRNVKSKYFSASSSL